jgi:hypothetical protein
MAYDLEFITIELLDGTIVEVEDEVLEAYGIDGIERLVNN